MGNGLQVIILGTMGQTPFAGMAWQVLHYLEGFRRLGFEVYYVEDTGNWPYDPARNAVTDDCSYALEHIGRLMAWAGLADRWAYRAATRENCVFGLSDSHFSRLFEQADVLVNLTGSTVLRDEHLRVPRRVFLETDPVLPQIEVAQGRQFTIDLLSAHTDFFTYAENLGAQDCGVPNGHFKYCPTRPPVILDWWTSSAGVSESENGRDSTSFRFTTIANWRQSGKDIEWQGETYTWSKHQEFLKFIGLPRRINHQIELALSNIDQEATELLTLHGWRIVRAVDVSTDISQYNDYIRGSRGEFTVAKDQNVRLRSGWFSDRSVCYLAAGAPVITQDTGFGNILPTGEGLFAFNTMDEILEAFDRIDSDYEKHSRVARDIAEEYFSAERVVGDLVAKAGF
jgi:hypothetical protein